MNDPPDDREHHRIISDAESSTRLEVNEMREDREVEERDDHAEDNDDGDQQQQVDDGNHDSSGNSVLSSRENGLLREADRQSQEESNNMLPSESSAAAQPDVARAAAATAVNQNSSEPPFINGQSPPAYYPPFRQSTSPSAPPFQPTYPAFLPPLPPFPTSPSLLDGHPAVALAHYYESQMRDHAAAYANAAAGAAWAAFQVAQAAHAATTGGSSSSPSSPPQPPVFGSVLPPPPPPPPVAPLPYYQHPSQGLAFANSHNPMLSPLPQGHSSPEQMNPLAILPPHPQEQNGPPFWTFSPDHRLDNRPTSRRKRVHQRPPNDAASPQQTASLYSGKVRRRLRSDGDSSSSGSSFSLAHRPRTYNKKKKARSDESLLGKTPVSALYEWCNKRKQQPIFRRENADGSDFEISVTLEDTQESCLGKGNGATKNAAKQLAAKRALQRLVPGVLFDEPTGILISLPKHDSPEDLAYLAKQLAIKHEDDDTVPEQVSQDSKKRSSSSQPKRTLDVYPGTSTTSEDDDENTYYTTRGASVCSSLLYAIIQIDPNLPEAPIYSYTVDQDWPGPSQNAQLRRKVASSNQSSAIRVHRGSHTCTAKLQQIQDDGNKKILEATGVGSSKREARHVASARLLALLFPDCPSMVEVKAAAEATREQYAASKARKLQLENAGDQKPAACRTLEKHKPSRLVSMENDMAAVLDGDIPLPSFLMEHLRAILSLESTVRERDPEARQVSRLRQLELEVDRGLQRLKDEHESLPETLTEDDVGRTVLRRASAEDLPRIRKLLHEHTGLDEEITARLWSTSSFVLVLCRAIAAFEDPPLGCAILTLGFGMEKGKLLRVAQIGNEPHLPQERLVECLQTFAVCMNASLVTKNDDTVETIPARAIRSLLESQVNTPLIFQPSAATASTGGVAVSSPSSSSLHVWHLQSVKEEDESEGASSIERRSSKQKQAHSSKPSKRSRKK